MDVDMEGRNIPAVQPSRDFTPQFQSIIDPFNTLDQLQGCGTNTAENIQENEPSLSGLFFGSLVDTEGKSTYEMMDVAIQGGGAGS